MAFTSQDKSSNQLKRAYAYGMAIAEYSMA